LLVNVVVIIEVISCMRLVPLIFRTSNWKSAKGGQATEEK